MKISNRLFPCLLILLLFACSSRKKLADTQTEAQSFIILQMNDVYEISPLENGTVGGLARVASIRQKLLQENPNIYTVLAGDFLNPSLIGTMKLEGERIKGRHIVEVLNTLGLDLAGFGNHEFDLDLEDLQSRIDEAEFEWIGGNVWHQTSSGKRPFQQRKKDLAPYKIIELPGTDMKMGIFTLCLDANKVDYVHYDDIFASAEAQIAALEPQVDILVGLTHLEEADDHKLAQRFPQIDFIMGGHDHSNMMRRIRMTPIAKADANAKTVYIHRFLLNPRDRSFTVSSELVKVNESIPDEPQTAAVIARWNAIAEKSFRELGFNPNEVLTNFARLMDAREVTLRFKPAPFGQLVARAISAACPQSEGAILNSGSIRVDDVLKGNFTQYDVMRALPFGGDLVEVNMTGELLLQVLNTAWEKTGSGAFLQWDRIRRTEAGQFTLQGKPIDPNRVYRIAMPGFLLTGLEIGLEFLTPDHPGVKTVHKATAATDLRQDIRKALIRYLQQGGK